jgi:hypothetical protein
MKFKDVHQGHIYKVRISGNLVPVRLDSDPRAKTWEGKRRKYIDGTNLVTGRAVTTTAGRCQREYNAKDLLFIARQQKDPRARIRILNAAQPLIEDALVDAQLLEDLS